MMKITLTRDPSQDQMRNAAELMKVLSEVPKENQAQLATMVTVFISGYETGVRMAEGKTA